MLQCFFVGVVLAHHMDICPQTGKLIAKIKLLPGQAKRLFNDRNAMSADGMFEIIFKKSRTLSMIRKLKIGDEIGIGACLQFASASREAIDPTRPLLGEHIVRLTQRRNLLPA